MAGDETLLDVPVTPAPVFAYRALRGIFFGSPSTPPAAGFGKTQSQHDKENHPSGPSSPRKSMTLGGMSLQPTSSQKRKRSGAVPLTSPTKSCLRTPGAPTPRREMLRDINVTFKDSFFRDSSLEDPARNVSPSATTKHVPVTFETSSQTGLQSPTRSTIAKSRSKRIHHIVPSSKPPLEMNAQHAPAQLNPTIAIADLDLQTYMQMTEKEMKKLIRYGQKMREYARKQDDENMKLKSLIEALQMENERLKNRVTDGEGPGVDNAILTRTAAAEPPEKKMRMEEKGQGPVSGKMGERLSSNIPGSASDHSKTGTKDHRAGHTVQKLNGSLRVTQPSHKSRPVRLGVSPICDVSSGGNLPPASEHPDSASNEKPPGSGAVNPVTNQTLNSNIAPDRLVAARARLRKRSELRKASATSEYEAHHDAASQIVEVDTFEGRPSGMNWEKTSRVAVVGARPATTTKTADYGNEGEERASRKKSRDKGRGTEGSSMLDWAGL